MFFCFVTFCFVSLKVSGSERSLKIYAKSQFARLRLMMVIPKQCKLR